MKKTQKKFVYDFICSFRSRILGTIDGSPLLDTNIPSCYLAAFWFCSIMSYYALIFSYCTFWNQYLVFLQEISKKTVRTVLENRHFFLSRCLQLIFRVEKGITYVKIREEIVGTLPQLLFVVGGQSVPETTKLGVIQQNAAKAGRSFYNSTNLNVSFNLLLYMICNLYLIGFYVKLEVKVIGSNEN